MGISSILSLNSYGLNLKSVEYQFQISSDKAFNSLIEEKSPISTTRYQLSTSLEYNKIYYWRIATIDVNTGSKNWTDALQITPKTGIISITNTITNIGAVSASCGGIILSDGGDFITERGVVFSIDPDPTINNNKIIIGSGIGNFTYDLKALMTNTTYHFKAYAINGSGTYYGNEILFTTQSGIVNLITSSLTRIGANSAFCGGTILNDGGEFVTESGVVFNTDSNPTTSNNKIVIGFGTGDLIYQLTGLMGNTTYYLKAYAINSLGTFYGQEIVFTTQSRIIKFFTSPIIGIGANSAVYEGNIASTGGSIIIERGVVFSNDPNPTTSNSKIITTKKDSIVISSGEYIFRNIITGLKANTTYYVRAFAVNKQDTYYGDEVSFTTIFGGLTGTVTDVDGNIYPTVTIGNQVWMGENLKTTKYRNGDPIPNVTNNKSWEQLITGAYCNYNNDLSIANTYGRLYNKYVVTDSRNIAPTGWHVPTVAEWTTLTNYLGGYKFASGKLREFGTTHWIGDSREITNESGFTGLPSGYRFNGQFTSLGYSNGWMSSGTSQTIWQINANSDDLTISPSPDDEITGWSVRCIKD